MQSIARAGRFAFISLVAIVMAACGGQKEPAQKLLADIDATVIAASDEAAKYIPDQLEDVASKYDELKVSFAKQDYAAVLSGGPAVLGAAQTLATAAAAKKDEILKGRNDTWTLLAASVPDSLTAVQNRIEELQKPSNKHLTTGMNLDAAKLSVDEAASLWSKAQAAFASGNMDEAVRTAQDVKAKVDAVAASLKLDLAAPVA
jgi:urease accessory protein UreF